MIVAQLGKLLLSLSILSTTLFAIEPTLLLAQIKYEKTKNEYEKKISVCSIGEEIAIPIDNFHALKLTKEQWRTVLLYFSKITFEICTHNEKSRFVFAVNSYLATAKHFKVSTKSASIYSAETMFKYAWKDYELELSYLAIEENKRNFLEKAIPNLKKPFNVLKTFDIILASKLLLLPN